MSCISDVLNLTIVNSLWRAVILLQYYIITAKYQNVITFPTGTTWDTSAEAASRRLQYFGVGETNKNLNNHFKKHQQIKYDT